ncbi:MAG: hypothetical protein AAGN35_21205 [Bacteroidota bacterium]
MMLIGLFMLLLGTVQVLSALIGVLVTKNPHQRRHFGYYLLGVFLYFSLHYIVFTTDLYWEHEATLAPLLVLAVVTLAVYNVIILLNPWRKSIHAAPSDSGPERDPLSGE